MFWQNLIWWHFYGHSKIKVKPFGVLWSKDVFTTNISQFHKILHISCSWHQITIQPILFSPIFPPNFSHLEQLKNKTNFLLVQNSCFFSFVPMKSLFSFSNAQTEKNLRKKLEKTKLVVWWFDVMTKILVLVFVFNFFSLAFCQLTVRRLFTERWCQLTIRHQKAWPLVQIR